MATVIPASIAQQINSLAPYGLTTPLRLAHFLAQCHHESAGFNVRVENLNYSAKGLRATFPKYFPDNVTALAYERQAARIADRVYANRMGNGNEQSGDGYKYRGRGFIQLTGKNNYAALGAALNEDFLLHPDSVADNFALASAAWFWQTNGINAAADKGATKEAVIAVTKKINGGTHGLEARVKLFQQYCTYLHVF